MYVKRLQNVNNNFLENDIGMLILFNQSRERYSIIIVKTGQKAYYSKKSNFT